VTTAIRDTIRVGDATIECFVAGRGEPIVMLPAAGLEAGYLADLGRRLADAGFRTVAINVRGTGASAGTLTDITLHTLAADVAGVIEGVADGSAHVLAHGFSSRIARCLVADRPDLVRSVVLLGGFGYIERSPEIIRAMQAWFRADATEAECLEVMRYEVADPAMAPHVFRALSRQPAVAAACHRADRATPESDWARPSSLPFLIVQGLDDRISPPSSEQRIRDAVGPRAGIAGIPDAGHMLLLEQPDAVGQAVTTFLRTHA
jgi:pimeloyl-ACP methyl ester carboxylesterase